MKVSVCITTFNEENNISLLLESLLKQSHKPDEIVIVDGGSADKTIQIIRHFQKKDNRIRLVIKRCSRSEGRNISCDLSKNEIIAMTDAGCIPDRHWLKEIISPFRNEEVDIVAGFYTMKASNTLQKAFSVFLGVNPKDFNIEFLPSTRSIAFRKRAWEKIGGFKESLNDTAEDTFFNYEAIKLGLKFARVKTARVEWEMPKSFSYGINKIYKYAKGDAKTGIWLHSQKNYVSHNIKAFLILLRYLLGLILFIYSFSNPLLLYILLILVAIYVLNSYRKVYLNTGYWKAGLWGIIIQFASDFAVIIGLIKGIIKG